MRTASLLRIPIREKRLLWRRHSLPIARNSSQAWKQSGRLRFRNMAKKQFDLIVFDWDGTLMDSTATIVRSIQLAAKDLGLTVPSRQAAARVIGLGLQDALKIAVPELDPKDYARMAERYRHHYFSADLDLRLFEGVREMLEDLSGQGYFLTVA